MAITWKDWVAMAVTPEKIAHRKIIVQMIDAARYTCKWQSYDRAVEVLDGPLGSTPWENAQVIAEFAEQARSCGWNPTKCRNP